MNTAGMTTAKNGAPIGTTTQYQSFFAVHPDHAGFVLGKGGDTVRKIGSDTKCYVRIQEPNEHSAGMPWFIIKGNSESSVATAFHRLRTIANEAERRMPRMTTRPAVKLNVVSGPKTPPPPEVEVTVETKTDDEGNEILVDPNTNDVYDREGRLIGYFRDGKVLARTDATN